ncbi:MAG: hypothetical protein AVDCRST_MAG87-2864 [uncultured Thermomicrobiales bacterium]|uniref:Uncharacterized protein n=1 Tax=uncultured Thermomicrobiales bacterium TaxID=1645740 RepID=A0A6J4VDL1_9BACT|nr:MAG: hypothetical protein AVDCRST_MAG87-2864 [uncultured Thermomicrobiales bacterium]
MSASQIWTIRPTLLVTPTMAIRPIANARDTYPEAT